MKRYGKLLGIIGLLSILSLTVTGLASADVIRGVGWLHAEGSGTAVLKMSGQVEIVSHGSGVVYIRGAELIQAEGNGKRTDLPNGGAIFRGFEGKITATGERMYVRIVGRQIEFTARGKGTAILRGHGHYETGSGNGDWQPNGLSIQVVEEGAD